MAAAGWDHWGMTENAELTPHLQSYFLVLRAGALRAPVLRRFFESVLPYRNKKNVILAYEAGLSPLLAEHGLRGGAAFPPESLPPAWWRDLFVRGTRPWAFRRKKNPTLYYADRLWAAGMPYLKLELLRSRARLARRLGVAQLVEGRPELAW
jgi:hypothetical protein